MANSSIHIQNGFDWYTNHNDRSHPTPNSIFKHNKNEIWNDSAEAKKLFEKELKKRSAAYTKRTKQKLQKKTTTHLSCVVNLNFNHTLKDVQKVASLLEATLDTKVFQIAVHRDEGHVTESGEEVVNYHAHIEFLGLDQEGRAIRQKLDRKTLIGLQSDVAMVLEMKRGTNYTKERVPRPKRLSDKAYKEHKQQETKTVKATVKFLKAQIEQMRAELQARSAKRADYAQLEALKKELLAKIKAKNLTIKELEQELADYKEENALLRLQNQGLRDEITTLTTSDIAEELKELRIDSKQDKEFIAELVDGYDKLEEIIFGDNQERNFDELVDRVTQLKKLDTTPTLDITPTPPTIEP